MNKIDIEKLRRDIDANIETLCRNFFPQGKKIGNQWCLGDISGLKGRSLKIELRADDKKGLYHDWATDDSGDFLKLLQEHYGSSFAEVAQKIQSFLGTSYLLADPSSADGDKHSNQSPKHRFKSREEPAAAPTPAPIDWNWHVEELRKAPELLNAQAQKRKWTHEFCAHLLDHGLIGVWSGCLAFPSWQNGSVIAVHYVVPKDPRNDWFYHPKGLGHGAYATNEVHGAKTIVAAESYWDLLSYLDFTGLYLEDNATGLCTRGKDGTSRLEGLIPPQAKVVVLPQNDFPGLLWLRNVRELIGRKIKKVSTPPEIKDFSDWRASGLTLQELHAATIELKEPPKTQPSHESTSQQKPPPWGQSVSEGGCTSLALAEMKITPREPVFDDWCLVGDLGFIFAARGLGKTWLAMHLAHGAATLTDVGLWKTHRQLKTLYLDGEMPPQDIQARDRVLGQPTDNLIYVNHQILFDRTGRIMNLANPEFQNGILSYCQSNSIGLLCLDNLSTLASGVDENKSIDWEIIQPWLLRVRRSLITVLFIHHAGRNNEMRGSSKREDPASWVLRLDDPKDIDERAGAHFISRFTKWRCQKQPKTYEWKYKPILNNEVCLEVKEASPLIVFRTNVENGLDTCTMIAEEMSISPGHVSRLATQAVREGWLEIKHRKYILKTE